MALIGRLAILGAAGAAAAYFLKQKQGSDEGFGAASSGTGTGTAAPPESVGDDAAAGTGTAETLKESGEAQETETSAAPEGDEGAQATTVSEVVMPDTSADPLVREQENAAAAEAGAIGGTPETLQSSDADPAREPIDPAMRPVIEGAGEEHETLTEHDAARGVGREREGSDRPGP